MTLLGRLIRGRCQALGIGYEKLARLTGIDHSVLYRIEHGRIASPSPDKLARIADALGLPSAELFEAAGYTTPDDLPSFRPYLRSKYGHLPAAGRRELEDSFRRVQAKYGYTGHGPADGEDEGPPPT